MEQYAGIDVSLDSASVCIVDAQGKILKEAKVACEPEALIAWFAAHGTPMARIGLEAGPLSQWLYAEMKAAGLPVELLETRHVRAAFKAMPVKTDRKDARGIAQLMRLGWFRPVHCKSLPAQEVRALLTTRKLLQGDLSEAWREGTTAYATVAMRYAIQDWKVDRTSQRVVAGDPFKPEEVVEVWTFRRDDGGPWKLSAVQQTV